MKEHESTIDEKTDFNPESYNLSFEKSDSLKGEYLVFDLETTGFPVKSKASPADLKNWPRVIQISWILLDKTGKLVNSENHYVKLDEKVAANSIKIHGITDDFLTENGDFLKDVLLRFLKDVNNCNFIVAHNIEFDVPIIESEFYREGFLNVFAGKKFICTMNLAKNICKLPGLEIGKYKEPTLEEMMQFCFYSGISNVRVRGLHDASADTAITAKCFLYFLENKLYDPESQRIMEKNNLTGRWNFFFVRIILPSLLSISLFILTIFIIIIPRFKENILADKREMIRELTNSAWSILQQYENMQKNGVLSKEEAQKEAISKIKFLRYGEESKDYFWITDMHPQMVMHPYLGYLDGHDLSEFKDPHGKKMFVEFVKVVKKQGHGYVDYMWQYKDDSSHIVPKISYVKIFQPWGWIIGTGVYVEDVKKEIKSLTGKMIKISIGITIIIILLLVFNTHHTIKIEQSRIIAENNLKESKERYRTLVEAATEGLVMLVNGLITHSNKTFSELTGFTTEELSGKSFLSILKQDPKFHGKNGFPDDGKYEAVMMKKGEGSIEVLLIISSIEFSEAKANIIIVKDISIVQQKNLVTTDFNTLIRSLKVGFFRTTIDLKGKFIAANPAALSILGFSSMNELSGVYILELFEDIDDKRSFRKKLLDEGSIHDRKMSYYSKNGEKKVISLSMVVVADQQNVPAFCDGIIEDITEQVNFQENAEKTIHDYQNSWLMLEQNITSFLKPAVTAEMSLSVREISEIIKEQKTDYIVLTQNNHPIGVITTDDINNRLIAEKKSSEIPAFEIMSSPVLYTNPEFSLREALVWLKSNHCDHIIVRQENELSGIIASEVFFDQIINSVDLMSNAIANAKSVNEISVLNKKMIYGISPLIESGIEIKYINRKISEFSDHLTKRIIELAVNQLGEPPVPFAFIALGSVGRSEQTLATDQDNAIIFQDIEKEKHDEVKTYFLTLAKRICDDLNSVGYHYCPGNNMASNPKWCQPYSKWESYFAGWILTPDPKNLLDISIFFDFRTLYGDESFSIRLKQSVNRMTENKTSFFYNMIDNLANTKISVTGSSGIQVDSKTGNEVFDIKKAIAAMVTFVRIYSIYHKTDINNTFFRIQALADKKVFSKSLKDELTFGYNFLMQIRFRHQVSLLAEGNMPNNHILIKNLNEAELMVLKKVLSQISGYNSKLNLDFKGNVV